MEFEGGKRTSPGQIDPGRGRRAPSRAPAAASGSETGIVPSSRLLAVLADPLTGPSAGEVLAAHQALAALGDVFLIWLRLLVLA